MYDPEQITFFAKTDARGQQVPFGIKANDRTRHVYVIGKTGMGKSTLLENMAVQDIKNGNGLAFIDPHGQTAETLLDYIPEERKDDVVYFAPFDTDNPISFNVMEDVGPDKRHLVVSGLMSVFKKIWVDAWSARMEYILSNTLMALLEYPDATLLGVNRMLSDKEYRMRVIENITDPAVKSFWVDEFLKYNERYMQEAGDAIKNKIGQFTSNPLIRNIIGQPHSSFDIREIMDDRKILIMNLSKGLVGEQNANLLGSMLTTRIYLAAMSRADRNAEEMKNTPNFYFYVDEFQSFANATFADILSEARKYKLNLTIAHQYIEQMEEEVRNAVFGNVGTIISFRVGPFDAEILETVYTPTFLAPDIVNLGFAQIYLTLMIDGIGSHPFSATTLPPIELSGVSCKDMVIKRSRELYTKPREGVETIINAWHAQNFSNKPPYVPKHLREEKDGGTLPNTPSNNKPAGNNGKPAHVANGNSANHKNGATNGNRSNNTKRDTPSPANRNHTGTQNGSGTQSPKRDFKNNNQAPAPEAPRTPAAPRTPYAERTPARTENNGYVKKSEEGASSRKQTDTKRPPSNAAPVERKESRPASATPKEEHVPYKERIAKKAKNLDDLRSVLQGISHGSKDTDTPSKEENAQRSTQSQQNSKPTKNGSELKAALAEVLEATKKDAPNAAPSAQPEAPRNPEKKIAHQRYSSFTPQRQQEQQAPSPQKDPVAKMAAAPQDDTRESMSVKNGDDPLSLKKLEKMMRVTTSDKPPIK